MILDTYVEVRNQQMEDNFHSELLLHFFYQ